MKSPLDVGTWLELQEVDSTQDEAIAYLRGEKEGEVPGIIYAHHQRSGRGRYNRKWHSANRESLTMTLIFRGYANHPKPWLIGMAVSAAAAATMNCQLWWPNDLVYNGKKLGGILTQVIENERWGLVPIVGVGLNLNNLTFPNELQERATSLRMLAPGAYEPQQIAKKLLDRLSWIPEPESWQAIQATWSLFDATPGKHYRLTSGEEAIAQGIGPEGELICSVNGQVRRELAAEAIMGNLLKT